MKKRGDIVKALALSLSLIFLLQFLTGFWVMQLLQRRLDLKTEGIFWPVPFKGSFYSANARLEWKNRVTLLSGKIEIDYNVIPLVLKNSIRVKIHGSEIQARLSGDWAKVQGVENIKLDLLEADLEVVRKGLGEIYLVRAESPSFQFHIQKN